MEQILTELALLDALFEWLVRGSDDAHIHAHRLGSADAIERAIRQHTQQARLQFERHVADFIEEQRAAACLLKPATAQRVGTGECPAFMSKQFGFEQIARNGGRVQRHERAACARAMAMKRTGDEFLASAGFAGDQHRHVGLRQAPDRTEDFLHGNRRRLRQHAFVARPTARFRAFGGFFFGERLLDGAGDEFDGIVDIKRFGKVVKGAALERGYRAIEIAVRSHNDDRQTGVLLLDILEQHKAARARHADIRHECTRRLSL